MFAHSAVLVFDSEAERTAALETLRPLGWGASDIDCWDHGEPGERGNYACTISEVMLQGNQPSAPLHIALAELFK